MPFGLEKGSAASSPVSIHTSWGVGRHISSVTYLVNINMTMRVRRRGLRGRKD